ncbi:MAG: ABC transporter ATP-binding protein [Desulfobacterales bacterium]
MIEAVDIQKAFRIGKRSVPVLRGVSLSVGKGEFMVVRGESGSGKTTLLSVLSGLDYPDSGAVRINGTDITRLPEDALAPIRNRIIGFVFQAFHLVPSLTALENVMFPAELRNGRDAAPEAGRLLAAVGMAGRMDNFPHQLSGGEQQRVAICRALVNRPLLVFADEPTGNLDSRNGAAILDLLTEFQRELGTTLVLVTHNPDIAKRADRVVVIEDGRIRDDHDR